jgi:hypothetical protein
MKRFMVIAALVVVLVPAWTPAQPPGRVPDLDGPWYMNGDPDKPTSIEQRGEDATFTNEKGERARGTIERDRVWIPEWTDGKRRGLEGSVRRDRIVWPNGTYWSRRPDGGRPR